jgi:alkylated DNA repair protein alkB family protein 1
MLVPVSRLKPAPGHVDRSEPNMHAPLVSVSLGLSCIFLIGGAGRDDGVTAVMVRSGDATLLAETVRKYYHGVPRVLAGTAPDHFKDDPFLKDSRINLNIRQVFP